MTPLTSIARCKRYVGRDFVARRSAGAKAASPAAVLFGVLFAGVSLAAQGQPAAPPAGTAGSQPPAASPMLTPTITPAAVPSAAPPPVSSITPLPNDYVIGADDVLSVVFWRVPDMSAEVTVRPDGRISLPLINEIHAAGLTPEAFRASVATAATKFMESPTVTIVVKQINSRKVFITGEVAKPGPYPLNEPTTVIQLIAKAGGLNEYADKKRILVIRAEKRPDGQPWSEVVNYSQILDRVNLRQNVELKIGDTVVVR